MFGTYRYILAMMVVESHLGKLAHIGPYAVFSFYMLSGYLMTLVLNERYGFDVKGITRYLSNRALRLYPPYLIVLLFSAVVVFLIPETAAGLKAILRMPDTLLLWVRNLTLTMDFDVKARLVPPAWSLFVEIVFYVLMGVLLSRRRAFVFIWLALSVIYTGYLIYTVTPWDERYYPVIAATLPFSVGAALYHLRQWFSPGAAVLNWAVPLFLVNAALWYVFPYGPFINARMLGFYLHVIISAVLLLCLSRLRVDKFEKYDRFLGELSYPLFLCHWSIGVIVSWVGGGMKQGVWLFLLSLVPAHIAAYFVHAVVEARVNKVRDRVRGGVKAGVPGVNHGRVAPESSGK